MTILSLPPFYKKAEGLACFPLENGLIVSLPASPRVLVLNQTAHTIWESLEGVSRQALLFQLSEKYGLAEATLETEIGVFLEKLIAAGLITDDEAPYA